MKPEIENLKKLIAGDDLNGYQLQDATDEFYKLLKYVDDLEKLRQPLVSGSLPLDFEAVQAELNKSFDNIRMGAEHTLYLNEKFEVRNRQ